MIDDDTVLLINGYLDGELSASETLAMERRLAADPALRTYLQQLRTMSHDFQAVLTSRTPLDEAVSARVASGFIPAQDQRYPASRRSPFWKDRAVALAASMLVGVGLGYGLAGPLSPWPAYRDPAVGDMVFAAHLRALAAPQPFDIASSDRHVVKPWFNGRSTIAPIAPDLSGDGFPLLGGRIDIVRNDAVPTLVYGKDKHVISVTVVPTVPGLLNGEESHAGSSMVRFVVGTLTYIAVSDLNLADLRRFVRSFQAAT